MLSNYKYRILKTTWGIAINLRAEWLSGVPLPANAIRITDGVRLSIDLDWQPTQADIDYLKFGLGLVADEIEKHRHSSLPIVVRLADLDFNPTDYQPEGLALAIAGWASREFGLPQPVIDVTFDRALNRYKFAFDRILAPQDASAVQTNP